jgi:hypothetical protein
MSNAYIGRNSLFDADISASGHDVGLFNGAEGGRQANGI